MTDLRIQLVNGEWTEGAGERLVSTDPSTGLAYWEGRGSSVEDVAAAIQAARSSFSTWRLTSLAERQVVLRRFVELVDERAEELALAIAHENGKPLWEARTEVSSLKTKLDATVDAFDARAHERIQNVKGRKSVTRFRPHGVMVVLGPFNFPMSMPNSHVMPAIYAGNTVVFKPSELTPVTGALFAKLWDDAGLPPGTLNVVQGGAGVGKSLVQSDDVDGVLFIGSARTGVAIAAGIATQPEKQLALEMGGNGPLVIWSYSDVRIAVHLAIQSAYISAGQRCTAARRLVVREELASEFLAALSAAIKTIRVGPAIADPGSFMGPMISATAADRFMTSVEGLINADAVPIVPCRRLADLGAAFVSPGLVDITGTAAPDEEIFGPLLQVQRVDTFDDAIRVANATDYGLSAGLVSTDRDDFERFLDGTKAGIVNWNQPLTGATTFAPFGGAKASGNYRPAGYLSVDYCSYATASIEDEAPEVPVDLLPGLSY